MEQHAFSEDAASVRAPPFRTEPDPAAIKPMGERRASKEDEFQQPTDSPLRHDAVGRKTTSDATQHQYGDRSNPGDPPKRTSRMSGGSDRSVEQSPLHPHNQVKAAAKSGVSSPSWERKGSSEGGHVVAPNTPSRLKMRTGGRGDESPEKGAAVPKFGEWDESNPSSADGFTHIFNKVREEKQTGSAKVPMISNDSMYLNSYNQGGGHGSSGCWCFNWRKK